MASEAITALWAVVRREMSDIHEHLQARVGGEWWFEADPPFENCFTDWHASVEVYGRPTFIRGRCISLAVGLADSPYHRPRPLVEVLAKISEQPWPRNAIIAVRTIKPPLDDPDREVEALVADFGRQFVEFAAMWRG
jgi:hypothetical protein